MQLKSQLANHEAGTYSSEVLFNSQNVEAMPSPLSQLRTQISEYGSLLVTFLKLYVQGRILMSQNYLLSCQLRMWDAAFLYMKVQIFFMRLARGFPPGQCWPRK